MHADLGAISCVPPDLVLTKPIVGTLMKQYTAAMRIDMNALIVGPYLPRLKCLIRCD